MRIVLYSHHSLFEPALSLVDALADQAEVHLLLEVPAGDWRLASFEAAPGTLPPGLVPGDAVLAPFYPDAVRAMWRKAATFQLVSHGRWRSRDPRSALLSRRVLRWIRSLEPDVLHVDDVDMSPRLAMAMALHRPRCPVVVGCHDPDPHTGERRWALKRLTRALILPFCDAVVVHHSVGAEALRRRHPRLRAPVHVVRLGAYTFMQHLAPAGAERDGDRTDVLLFGRVTPYKGVESLMRAAPLVAERVPGVRFTVAGKPVANYRPPEPPELGEDARVETRYDYVPNTEIGGLIRSADVAVCPYTDASQSGVVLTAYAFGCPVVATDVGGLGEYVREGMTGLVVPARDHEALAGAIVRCLREPGLLAHLRRGVHEAVAADLSWERVASELMRVYRASVPRRGGVIRRPQRQRQAQSPSVPKTGHGTGE
jgi:alpha-maltose-1-phosphate synthase